MVVAIEYRVLPVIPIGINGATRLKSNPQTFEPYIFIHNADTLLHYMITVSNAGTMSAKFFSDMALNLFPSVKLKEG